MTMRPVLPDGSTAISAALAEVTPSAPRSKQSVVLFMGAKLSLDRQFTTVSRLRLRVGPSGPTRSLTPVADATNALANRIDTVVDRIRSGSAGGSGAAVRTGSRST